MQERFTEDAKQVILSAEDEAKALGHGQVGTEHILLGLLVQDNDTAELLREMDVDYDEFKQQLIAAFGEKQPLDENVRISLTPRVKTVFELAWRITRQLGQNLIDPDSMLLGLAAEGEGVAARILRQKGIDFRRVQQAVLENRGMNRENNNEEDAPEAQGQNKGGKKNILKKFSRDLTEQAKKGELDPVIGRAQETERILQILSRRTKNNPCLIGEPGVGKTAIAEGLAQRIVSGDVPENLMGKRVVTLDLTAMVAGTKFRGEFEERMKDVVDEVRKDKSIILFIDEIHNLVGAGAAEGSMDAGNILKPALSRGEIQLIGATTLNEYRKNIEKDAALERRFQPILVEEPTVEESIQIMKGLRDKFEAHHKIKITDEAIEAAARLSERYITDRFLPDKAIDLMDEACSKVKLARYTPPKGVRELEKKLEEVKKEKEAQVKQERFEQAARLKEEEKKLTEELSQLRKDWEGTGHSGAAEITGEDIAEVVSGWTKIPLSRLNETEAEKLLHLEQKLHERVIGQDEAVTVVAKAVRRARAGLKDPNRPIGSFIFLGPTGVGKTELAKALAETVFGSEDAMVRIDMSEYMEKHTVSRLIGSPPGYVGYDEGGQLTEAIRRKPYAVVLFDEIEKAHPDVFSILLQIMDDGRLTDGQGRRVDFKNTIIIMTSNTGANLIKTRKSMGFGAAVDADSAEYDRMKDTILEEMKHTFRPEFLNRLDETVVFHALDENHIDSIIDILLGGLNKRMQDMGMELTLSPEARQELIRRGYDRSFGARPLKRVLRREVEDRISEALLEGKFHAGDKIMLAYENNAFSLSNAIDKGEEKVED